MNDGLYTMKLISINNKIVPFIFSFVKFMFIVMILYITLENHPLPSGPDSWFHVKYSKLMKESKHKPFIWLPYTKLNEPYPDHHYGFHV